MMKVVGFLVACYAAPLDQVTDNQMIADSRNLSGDKVMDTMVDKATGFLTNVLVRTQEDFEMLSKEGLKDEIATLSEETNLLMEKWSRLMNLENGDRKLRVGDGLKEAASSVKKAIGWIWAINKVFFKIVTGQCSGCIHE